jgi:hypothetical protein
MRVWQLQQQWLAVARALVEGKPPPETQVSVDRVNCVVYILVDTQVTAGSPTGHWEGRWVAGQTMPKRQVHDDQPWLTPLAACILHAERTRLGRHDSST